MDGRKLDRLAQEAGLVPMAARIRRRSAEDREDLVQAAKIAIFQASRQIETARDEVALARHIARKAMLTLVRDTRAKHRDRDEQFVEVSSKGTERILDNLETGALWDEVSRVMASEALSEGQRVALIDYLTEVPAEATALSLGVTSSTVRVQRMRALRKLRDILGDWAKC